MKKRDGRRYQYYVSQALLQGRRFEAGLLSRVPAQPIEDLVFDRVRRIATKSSNAVTLEHRRQIIVGCVRRLELGRAEVKIILAKDQLPDVETVRARMPPSDSVKETDDGIEITVRIGIKTWGGYKVIEAPDGGAVYDAVHMDHALIKALRQAHRWRQALQTGAARSIEEIATSSGQTEAYVRQLLPLAFLAPDVTEAILLGKQPRHVTVDRLVRMTLPLSWREQRRVLHIPA